MEFTSSIIIPTYNEQENIIPLVERIHRAMNGDNYQIVFVDDSSEDGTADICVSLAAHYPIILVRRNRRGVATAILDGIKCTSGQVIGVMDADLQHPPEVLPSLLRGISDGYDLVIASRYVPGGGTEGWRLSRKIISKGAIALAHILLPGTRRVADPVSGFFMFRRDLIKNVRLDPSGYKLLLEIMIIAAPRSIAEVPFTFTNRKRGKSKLSFQQEKDYLKHLFSLMRRKGEHLRFVKFVMVGAGGVVINEGLLELLKGFFGLSLPLASAIGIESSVVSKFLLNDFFTFRDRRTAGAIPFLRRGLRFNLVSLTGAGINWGVLLFLTSVFGIHYRISNLVGIGLATMWNYIINTWWTWE